MLKLKHINDSNKVAPIEAATKPATFKSHQQVGFDFVIENDYISGEAPVTFTLEQMISIFRSGVPEKLLQYIPRKQMIEAHEIRLEKDAEYKKYFSNEDSEEEVEEEVVEEVAEEVVEETKEEVVKEEEPAKKALSKKIKAKKAKAKKGK